MQTVHLIKRNYKEEIPHNKGKIDSKLRRSDERSKKMKELSCTSYVVASQLQ